MRLLDMRNGVCNEGDGNGTKRRTALGIYTTTETEKTGTTRAASETSPRIIRREQQLLIQIEAIDSPGL